METMPGALRLALAAACYCAAYGAGALLFWVIARRRGLATGIVARAVIAGLFGGIAAAVVTQLVFGAEPGRTLLGGVAGGWLAIVAAKRRLGITRSLGDPFAFALAGGEAIGRIGCFFAGCCYGKITSLPWAVADHGALRHPTQLYSALAATATLLVLARLERARVLPDGALFAVQGALLCATRFAIEFVREGPSYGGTTPAQIACVLGFAFFAWRLKTMLTRTASTAPA